MLEGGSCLSGLLSEGDPLSVRRPTDTAPRVGASGDTGFVTRLHVSDDELSVPTDARGEQNATAVRRRRLPAKGYEQSASSASGKKMTIAVRQSFLW